MYFLVARYRDSRDIDKIISGLPITFPFSYTVEQAAKDGLVDVSAPLPSPPNSIATFFYKVEKNEWALLYTVEQIKNELWANIYIYEPNCYGIRMWKYEIGLGGLTCFSRYYERAVRTVTNGDICEVWLVETPLSNQALHDPPPLKDSLLYSYFTK